MLNHRRNGSYNRATPTSCAVTIFGIGVVLTLAGIVLMIITKNSKHKDEVTIESRENRDEEGPSFKSNVIKQEKSEGDSANGVLKTSAPIVLGVGIAIIVLFFLAVVAVAWTKGLKSPPRRARLPATSGTSPNIALRELQNCDQYVTSPSPSSIHALVPETSSGRSLLHSNLPPSYDEVCKPSKDGDSSRRHDVASPTPV